MTEKCRIEVFLRAVRLYSFEIVKYTYTTLGNETVFVDHSSCFRLMSRCGPCMSRPWRSGRVVRPSSVRGRERNMLRPLPDVHPGPVWKEDQCSGTPQSAQMQVWPFTKKNVLRYVTIITAEKPWKGPVYCIWRKFLRKPADNSAFCLLSAAFIPLQSSLSSSSDQQNANSQSDSSSSAQVVSHNNIGPHSPKSL